MAVCFLSSEESYTVGQPIPNPPWDYTESGNTLSSRGSTVSSVLSGYGNKALQWQTSGNAIERDLWNQIRGSSLTGATGNTFYFGAMQKVTVVAPNTTVYPVPNGGDEGFDKWLELLSDGGRVTIQTGIRGAQGSAGTYQTFITQPCHGGYGNFHVALGVSPCAGSVLPTLQEYDSYWNNQNGYGRGLTNGTIFPGAYFPMSYGRWYAHVVKVVWSDTYGGLGEISQWVNGTLVMRFTGIKTSGIPNPTIEQFDFCGTYWQPSNTGPAHQRQMKRVVLATTLADITALGMMQDPTSAVDTTAPAVPSGVTIS